MVSNIADNFFNGDGGITVTVKLTVVDDPLIHIYEPVLSVSVTAEVDDLILDPVVFSVEAGC